MMKQLLSGTAVALMLVANPAIAQVTDDEAPETEVEEQMELDEAETDDQEAVELDAPEDDEDIADEPLDDDPDLADDPLDDEDVAEEPLDEEDVAEEPLDEEDVAERPTETYFAEQEDDEILATELMGVNVENPEGETLGSIQDILIDEEIGVKGVVIGVGGFLGLGQKHVAVNYDEIEHVRSPEGDVTLTFAGTTDELENAPEFRSLQQQIADAEADQLEQQQQMDQQQPIE